MKKLISTVFIAFTIMLSASFHALAMDMNGKKIHQSDVKGYRLVYSLIDMDKALKEKGSSVSMEGVFHLMVMAKAKSGSEKITKTGYIVISPDGTKQKAMAMKMEDGFGANINMKEKGKYKIKVKLLAGKKAIMDSFEFNMN